MRDYAKTIHQSRETQGQQQGRQTLNQSTAPKGKMPEHVKKTTAKGGRGFFTLIVIFVIVAVLFAVYRQYIHRQAVARTSQQTPSQTTPAQATNPQFDFYTVLPNGSTPGAQSNSTDANLTNNPATDSSATATSPPTQSPTASTTTASTTTTPATAPSTSATSAGPSQYYLNAGTFANSADAQQMLSQLLLLGVQANMQTSQDNGAPTYVVMVGPFADQDTLNIVKNQLAAHQIQANVVQQAGN